jgi:hypothetical protein
MLSPRQPLRVGLVQAIFVVTAAFLVEADAGSSDCRDRWSPARGTGQCGSYPAASFHAFLE